MILPIFRKFSVLVLAATLVWQCKQAPKEATSETTQAPPAVVAPSFNPDTAYAYVAKQVAFGPRVPNTAPHRKTGDWIVSELKKSGLQVTEQPFTAVTYDGKRLAARNIIGSFNPTAAKRIIVAAHWDSRPFADKDSVKKNQPIAAANDGGSGVAVLLEMARTIAAAEKKPAVGIDFIFFDAEDWGTPEGFTGETKHPYGGYCLGSEYWAKNLHQPNYKAFYGILLDMVGAKNATFMKEAISLQVAPTIVRNVWNTASQLGYNQYFVDIEGPGITDDHVPVIEHAKIPMIDIIDLKQVNPNNPKSDNFFSGHHRHTDNMDIIDKNTLKAVGQTVLQVLYQE